MYVLNKQHIFIFSIFDVKYSIIMIKNQFAWFLLPHNCLKLYFNPLKIKNYHNRLVGIPNLLLQIILLIIRKIVYTKYTDNTKRHFYSSFDIPTFSQKPVSSITKIPNSLFMSYKNVLEVVKIIIKLY